MTLGVSHKTASLELRERLALPRKRAEALIHALCAHSCIVEAASVSTCNRTEIYLITSDCGAAERVAIEALSACAETTPTALDDTIQVWNGLDAAEHLFRVVAGLESMVVGEAEVQGQVKRCFDQALAAGTTGPMLNRLFSAALQTGKRVRTNTALGRHPLSVPSVALALAGPHICRDDDREIALVGAGDMTEGTLRVLADSNARSVIVATRSRDRALDLARRFGSRVVGFSELPAVLACADVVISASAAPRPIIDPQLLTRALAERAGRSLLVIDLSVPRDVHPSCAELPGVTLYDLDDLQRVVSQNQMRRGAEVGPAERIVAGDLEDVRAWLRTRHSVTPTVAALRRYGEAVADSVLAANRGRWQSLCNRDEQRVEAMARAIVQRLLHNPTRHMMEFDCDDIDQRLAVIRDLFELG